MSKINIETTKQLIADRQQLLVLPKGQLVDLVLMLREQLAWQQTQIEALQLQVAAFQKNSTNSSKPPSSDLPGSGTKAASAHHHTRNSRQSSDRQSGGQPGHLGSTRTLVDIPDTVMVYAPETCENCGSELAVSGATDTVIARSQVVDIPLIVPVTTEYRSIARTCACGHVTKGRLPPEAAANGTVTIGSNASSLLVYLNSAHHLPYQRLQQVAIDLFNLSLSQGTIANKLEVAGCAAKPLAQTILEYLRMSPYVGSDETGVRVAGTRIWQWVWQNAQASYYAISAHRDYQTVADTFGENYTGCLIHDCYSAQNNTNAGWHQLCHAHLLRDLQFVIDTAPGTGTADTAWAYQLQRFLLRSQRARDHIWTAGFGQNRREEIIDHYYEQLEQFVYQELVGREAKRLQKRFKKHEDKILYFLTTPNIPPDNNGSERAIRNAKVKQKVSGGYRSHRGAERQAALLSVIETAKKQGLDVLETIQQLMAGREVQLFRGE